MRRDNLPLSIAPAYRGGTFGAIERHGFTLGPSMRQESLAQFGAIGAIGEKTQFRLPSLAVLSPAAPSRFSRFGDSGKTGRAGP
jgi:hypothetical protein